MENLLFKDLKISKEILKAISEMGFEEATPIQSQAIPHVLEGKDVIGLAQTGTGKTCAFGIPCIDMILPTSSHIQALIISPTRELAIQIAEELKDVSKYKRGIKILPIYGGQHIERQMMGLQKKPQIIIGTPGRIMDHMRRRTLDLSKLKMVVLDEADEMLNMGFREDIDLILQSVPGKVQTLLFSATMPQEILELTRSYQENPVMVKSVHKQLTVPLIEQYYVEVSENTKVDVLSRIIDMNNIKLGLVFCNTKKRVDELTYHMQARGYNVEALHGDMKQNFRDKVMSQFRKGQTEILVATDVAARGIDVDNIEAVFNYDIPNDEEYYVHRIGRTGRAGRTGAAYTFVAGRDIYKLREIMQYTKSAVKPLKPPSMLDIKEKKMANLFERLKNTINQGVSKQYLDWIEKLQSEEFMSESGCASSMDIAAGLLKLLAGETMVDVNEEVCVDISESTGAQKGMARFFVNIGKAAGVTEKDIIEAFSRYTSLEPEQIKKINIFDRFTFVEVPEEYAYEVANLMRYSRISGRKVSIEKALKKDALNVPKREPQEGRRPPYSREGSFRRDYGDQNRNSGSGQRTDRKFSSGNAGRGRSDSEKSTTARPRRSY